MRHTLVRQPQPRLFPTSLCRRVAILLAGLWLCAVAGPQPAAAELPPQDATAPVAAKDRADGPAPAGGLPKFRKIMIVGDSFAVGLAMTMKQSLPPKEGIALSGRGKVASGLNSPRFYDWEKALSDFLAAEKPEAVVVMLGGNDAKNGRGTPEWGRDYEAKARRLLGIAAGHGVKVFWIGLPPMREKAFSRRAWLANAALRNACAAAAGCRFIDSWDLFADAAGNFCAKKPVGGKAKALRGKDGVHFTPIGCKLLTDRIASGMHATSP